MLRGTCVHGFGVQSHVTSGFSLGAWNLWVLLTTQSLCGTLKCPVSKLEPDQG